MIDKIKDLIKLYEKQIFRCETRLKEEHPEGYGELHGQINSFKAMVRDLKILIGG